MPRIIDYPLVQQQLIAVGLICNYHNSGAFGFPRGTSVEHVGWIGPADPTLRPAARPLAIDVPPPHARNLAGLLVRAWETRLPGEAWLMPMAHWGFDLADEHRTWLVDAVRAAGVEPDLLASRSDGSAIAFADCEADRLTSLIEVLFERLAVSDFVLAFPDHPAVCLVHHHTQLWWTTSSPVLAAALRQLAQGPF